MCFCLLQLLLLLLLFLVLFLFKQYNTFTMSLFSDINTRDVGRTREKVKNRRVIFDFFECFPNIPSVYIREQRHGKRVLLLL